MSIEQDLNETSPAAVIGAKHGPLAGLAHDRATASKTRTILPGLENAKGIPLVVDLDGTLLRSDLLIETGVRRLAHDPTAVFGMFKALSNGKAVLKEYLCAGADCAPETLPYDKTILSAIRLAHLAGRPVYLASGSHEDLVRAVVDHLGIFNGYFATTRTINMSGATKAEQLVQAFGEKGFDYIGNDAVDLSVWARARQPIGIRTSARVSAKLRQIAPHAQFIDHERTTLKDWARQLRVHQYSKNVLVFVPIIAAHALSFESLMVATLAAIGFCLAASACYILNDLVDLQEDRAHRTKKNRPLARGDISSLHAVGVMVVLLVLAAVVSLSISLAFAKVLAIYFAITTAYSFVLKQILLVDVVTLAGLYTIRMVGGAVAVGISLSTWLMVFSLSIFVSLALMKRFVELTARADANLASPTNRDYENMDRSMIAALSAAAGFNAVTVLALYVSGNSVSTLYSSPEFLLLACPILIYWIGRALILAQRRQMQDDPVVFAITDPQSWLTALAVLAVFIAAV